MPSARNRSRALPPSGFWSGRLSQVGQTDWFLFPVRGGRTFTVVTQALNEAGIPTETKALPAIGVWDALDPIGAPSLGSEPGLNGSASGESWLRGDGRPDYTDNAWLLYADSVLASHLPVTGGPIIIHGLGFRPSDTVLIGGQLATVTSVSPTEITALAPAGGVTVTYTLVSGSAMLGCGQSSCAVTASSDGLATLAVTPTNIAPAVVTASLSNGASLQAHFTGGTPPVLSALTPTVSVAAGATVSWTTQALALLNGAPAGGQSVAWQPAAGISAPTSTPVVTGSNGIAAKALTVGPLSPGEQSAASACLNATTQCVQFTATGARPVFAWLEPVAGAAQTLSVRASPNQIVLRVRDMDGTPMAGGIVTLYQALYGGRRPVRPTAAARLPPCSPLRSPRPLRASTAQ